MEPRRIFITGANGFVGRHLIAHLLASFGPQVSIVAAVRPEEFGDLPVLPPAAGWTGTPEPNLQVVPFDLLDAAGVKSAVAEARPDWIVHLAARSSGADPDRAAITAVNVGGTRNLLEGAAELSPFPRTLVVSSGYVYGSTEDRPAREEDPIGPLWRFGPYTDSKIEMEGVARSYSAFAIIVRPFAHTGPGQSAEFAIPSFARQLARIERGVDAPVLRVGNLSARRDLLDVRDVVRAYECLLRTANPGEVFNVARGAAASMSEMLDKLRAQCRVPVEVEVDREKMRPSEIGTSSGDPLRLWMATNWTPKIPLETTLRDTLDFWRSRELHELD